MPTSETVFFLCHGGASGYPMEKQERLTMKLSSGNHAVEINMPDRVALWTAIRARLGAGRGFALATLNLDHLVKIRSDAEFARAYAAQDFIVADGRPIVWLSWIAGDRVTLMPGSDLIVPLCKLAADEGWPIALIGSTDEALTGAAAGLRNAVPGLEILHVDAPAMGFDPDGPQGAQTLETLAASGARLCFLALGAPKQERLAARGAHLAPSVGFASIGAGLDFIAGHQARAPRFMRAFALEWLWRALSNPRRMIPRYAACFAILPGLVVRAIGHRARR